MTKTVEFTLQAAQIGDPQIIKSRAAKKARLKAEQIVDLRVLRRSIDARAAQPVFRLRVEISTTQAFDPEPALLAGLADVSEAQSAIIIGTGPAGYFAALEMIELGIRPLLFDRGKDVQARRRDLRAIQQLGQVNPHSNYCFGEGGAGTYSDGKLYTRSHKRGSIEKVLRLLVEHGASSDILIDAHPHIGSNKLPKIVANIRQTIQHFGGEIHFESCLTDLILHKGKIKGVMINDAHSCYADVVVLATGHSARDVYQLLDAKGLKLEAKAFALGVRVEHSQSLIDRIQYRQSPRQAALPASSYRLASQVDGRGVFSFCMCPGGLVVPAATAPGEIVVNGMSLSRRDSAYANSGVVVALEPQDWQAFEHFGVLAGLEFQRSVEQSMFGAGNGSQAAPALRMTDFVDRKLSADLPSASYLPGLHAAPLWELLPEKIYARLRLAFLQFDTKMKGYFTAEANVIGTESRTSSPIRIPRDANTLMHPQLEGLFPCGEGAGFAGGIVSAAMDGQKVAEAVAAYCAMGTK